MTTAGTSARTCRFPGCNAPAVTAAGGAPGRPPEYCSNPDHNRAAAWRARRAERASAEGRPLPDDLDRPVSMARARAGELVDQVATQAGQLAAALTAVVEELRTLGDPDAAAVQIEAVTTEADQRVAEATARAARAERDQRAAELRRAEADAAAEEATDQAAQLSVQLQEIQDEHRAATKRWEQQSAQQQAEIDRLMAALDTAAAESAERLIRAQAAETAGAAAEARAAALGSELAEATEQLENAAAVGAAAAQRAHDAEQTNASLSTQLEGERSRAGSAEQAAAAARGEASQLSGELERALQAADSLRNEIREARSQVFEARERAAASAAELAGAQQRLEDERRHTEARLADQRLGYEERLMELRADLDRLRGDAGGPTGRGSKRPAT